MIMRNLTICFFLGTLIIIMSCESSTKNKVSEDKDVNEIQKVETGKTESDTDISDNSNSDIKRQIDLKAEEFVENLESGDNLSSFFRDNWTFIYNIYDSNEGSKFGQIDNLSRVQIDTVISLQVVQKGDDFLGDFDMDIDIKKEITYWSEFGTAEYENQENNVVYIIGIGDSNYWKLHYNDNALIVKLEYTSEDPG